MICPFEKKMESPSAEGLIRNILTWQLNSQLRHAGLDPASSVFLDSRLRGNDNRGVFNRRSNIYDNLYSSNGHPLGAG